MTYTSMSSAPSDTLHLGSKIGSVCRGGETFELVSDLGGGKTVFVQGLAAGLGYKGDVTSPTFVISRDYKLPNDLSLHHFDLYRIGNGDMAAAELSEFIAEPKAIVAVEWASNVSGVLPKERIIVDITSTGENEREIIITTTPTYDYLIQALQEERA